MFNNYIAMPTAEELQETIIAGSSIIWIILAMLVSMEALSYKTALALYKKDKNLYLQGLVMDFVNSVLLGTPSYVLTSLYLLRKDETNATTLDICAQTLSIMVIHSIGYYQAHKAFHTYPCLYKFHKFHHRYNTLTPPSAAAAVSVVEFLLAYVAPFPVAAFLLRPYRTAFHCSFLILGTGVILDHTPMFEEWSAKYFPAWLVNVQDHMEHHRKLNVHFAAPSLDIDWLVKQLQLQY